MKKNLRLDTFFYKLKFVHMLEDASVKMICSLF